MKPYKDYHPPKGWVKFETLDPGDTFHDIINGQPVQFVKLLGEWEGNNAVRLEYGELYGFAFDEFVYPVNVELIAELGCYGVKISEKAQADGIHAILAEVFNQCEARKVNDAWREEITKYFPSLGMMSFSGPSRVVHWMLRQIKEHGLPEMENRKEN